MLQYRRRNVGRADRNVVPPIWFDTHGRTKDSAFRNEGLPSANPHPTELWELDMRSLERDVVVREARAITLMVVAFRLEAWITKLPLARRVDCPKEVFVGFVKVAEGVL